MLECTNIWISCIILKLNNIPVNRRVIEFCDYVGYINLRLWYTVFAKTFSSHRTFGPADF